VSSAAGEQLPRTIGHRDDSRMFDLALGRDREELRLDALGHPDTCEAMLAAELSFEN